MNIENFFQNLVSLTSAFDPRVAISLFVLCAIGEIGISIPYVLESVWLLTGFHVGNGVLSPLDMVWMWLAAQAGRQVGSMGLYRIARFGMPSLVSFYHKLHLDPIFKRLMSRSNAVSRVNLASPFSVAFGRFFGMRIPMVLVMATKRRPAMLSLGVLLSSIIWDALYISLGAIFGSTIPIKPIYMLLICLATLTVIYLLTFLVRMIIRRHRQSGHPVTDYLAEN
jgi:membrane-associated protein